MNLEDYVREHALLSPGERVAVACSGGCDSMVLLHALSTLGSRLRVRVLALHVNHCMRGDESDGDARFVEEYCRAHNIPLRMFREDVPAHCAAHGLGPEEGARALRRSAYFRAIDEGFCDKVATAHHQRDNAETVLLHLLRGSGLRGACGIRPQSGSLIRPLLATSKEEILGYASEHGVPFRTDSSNADPAYARNYLRLEVLPRIRARFPAADRTLARFAENAAADAAYLDRQASELLQPKADAIRVRIPSEPALLEHALLLAFDRLGAARDVGLAHLASLCRLAERGNNGDRLELPNRVTAWLEYGAIALVRAPESVGTVRDTPLKPEIPPVAAERTPASIDAANDAPLKPGISPVGRVWVEIEEVPFDGDLRNLRALQAAGVLCLDRDKLPAGTVVRTPRPGDMFRKLNGGAKKLCDHFTDRRIPARTRANIPLLACGDQVLAIVPREIADSVKADENTRTLLRIRIAEEKEQDLQGE